MKKVLAFVLVILFVSFVFSLACTTTTNPDQSADVQGAEIVTALTGNQGEPVVMVHGNCGYFIPLATTYKKPKL